jgi:hypothetical protein
MLSTVVDRDLQEEKKTGSSEPPRIRYPLCGWSPRKQDRRFRECGFEWNTFEKGGVCPACLHRWTETQCLTCSRWSAHVTGHRVTQHEEDKSRRVLIMCRNARESEHRDGHFFRILEMRRCIDSYVEHCPHELSQHSPSHPAEVTNN